MSANRRQFLQRSAAAIAATTPYFFSTQSAFANASANDRPRLACIGVGPQGKADARELRHHGDIVALCDVDSARLNQAQVDQSIGAEKANLVDDYRRILDRNDVDVVCIATPDHWHSKIAIEALQAGKHVFCEKPLTLTLEENQLIRSACKRYGDRVFFVGTQQRGDHRNFLRAVNMVQKGFLGEIRNVTVGINGAPTGGPFPIVDPPKQLKWDVWLGQAPNVSYREKRCHYDFRWWYEYSGGKFTDWGAHHIDIATWALGEDTTGKGPIEIDGTDAQHPVQFVKGFPIVDDSYNTSHDFAIKCRYPSGVAMVVTSRGDNGILFEGTLGRLFVNRERITGKPIEEDWDAGHYGQDDLRRLYRGKPHESHVDNFYRTLREGGLPVSDAYSHLQTMNTCHLCSIAARLKRKIKWDPVAEQIVGDPAAAGLARREQRARYEVPRV
jgi:predicted dehydrogenase